MCLAIPGQVIALGTPDPLARMGKVDFGGVVKEVCFAYVPEVAVGDYVLVHVGFAISRIDRQAAETTWQTLAELEALEEIGDAAAGFLAADRAPPLPHPPQPDAGGADG
jgi:hydrogenase expression/formation protein HypC